MLDTITSHHAPRNATIFTRAGMTLYLAGRSYIDKGGSFDEMREIFNRLIAELNPNDDAETHGDMYNEGAGLSVSPLANGRDQPKHAQLRPSRSVPPVREPSAGYRAAAFSGEQRHAKTLLDKFKLSDGRLILDICPREFVAYKRDAVHLAIVEKHLGELSEKQKGQSVRALIAGFDHKVVKQIQKELSDAA